MARFALGVLTAGAASMPVAVGAESALPLRTESALDGAGVLWILACLVLLIATTAVLLWLYQRRFGLPPAVGGTTTRPLEVLARRRLSERSQAILLRCGDREYLVVESTATATLLALDGSRAAAIAPEENKP